MKEDTKKSYKNFKKEKKGRVFSLTFVLYLLLCRSTIKETAIQYDTKIRISFQCWVVKLIVKIFFS